MKIIKNYFAGFMSALKSRTQSDGVMWFMLFCGIAIIAVWLALTALLA